MRYQLSTHNATFKYAANETHIRYGTSNHAAARDILANETNVATIKHHNNTITTTAPPMLCAPKKTKDQIVFTTSCTTKSTNARFPCFDDRWFRQIKNAAMPMSVYKSVHTGPNTHPGGFNGGLSSPAYHVGICDTVASEPKIPAA